MLSYILVFIIIGAISFNFFEEDWDFVGALYYSTVTSTTIGFGDLVPDVTDFSTNPAFAVAKAIWTMTYIVLSKYRGTWSYITAL